MKKRQEKKRSLTELEQPEPSLEHSFPVEGVMKEHVIEDNQEFVFPLMAEKAQEDELNAENELQQLKSLCPWSFPVFVPESLEVKSEREEPDTEGHLTTIKSEIVTVGESCFYASHPDWIPDRSSPQNLIIVKPEDCSRSLGVSQEVSEEDFEFEFPDLEQFKARKAARIKENLSSINVLNPGKKPYTCTECGKSYKLKWNLQVHRKTHTGEKSHRDEKPYTCTECGKRFGAKLCLRKHNMIHTGEKPFTCTECGKSFNDKRSLRRHHMIHTAEKPFRCTECGKRFGAKHCLRKHNMIHTGEKPFTCTECGKSFSDKGSLRKHHMNHTGEKPFTCTECGKSFNDKGSLRRHHMIHTAEKPFRCTECVESFTDRTQLVIHQ
ncbi:uncharacterized protein O3C94_007273 [Discoglossus pictus]